jgi:probable F420-dependent oxidoreductase
MKVGITLPESGQEASRENIIQLAKQAENERFDSLWVWERLMWPLKPQTPYPLTPDGSHPLEFQNVFEPLETLNFVAANTEKIALGTCVIDMLFHNPVVLARRFATLDIFSKGRAICGLGIGWMKDEYQASNVPFQYRGKRADEYIQLLKQIWMNDVAEFDGEFYNIPASKIGPKPLQNPLPVYLGGFIPKTLGRIVKYDANGWLPVIGGPLQLDFIKNNMDAVRDEARKANKDPNKFKTILLTYPKLVDTSSSKQGENGNQRIAMTGTIDDIGDDIKRIKDFGVDHIIFGYNFSPLGREISKMLDISKQLSRFAR